MDSIFKKIDNNLFPSMPHFKQPVDSISYWDFDNGNYKGYEEQFSSSDTSYSFLIYPYVLFVVNKNNEHILTVAIQQTDFRELAFLTKERISDLNNNKKGHLSDPMIVVFSSIGEESLGSYNEQLQQETVFNLLSDLVAEKLDLFEDPIKVSPLSNI
jgi:hypothetical protein